MAQKAQANTIDVINAAKGHYEYAVRSDRADMGEILFRSQKDAARFAKEEYEEYGVHCHIVPLYVSAPEIIS